MKKCFKCGIEKPLSQFYKHSKMIDGHLNKCKECTKNDSTNNRWKNIDRIREYDRIRGSLPHRVKAREEYQKTVRGRKASGRAKAKWSRNNPERRHAQAILGHRVRIGEIIKPEQCQRCGRIAKLHGHHHDYSKPLDVEWLCPICHRQEHKE